MKANPLPSLDRLSIIARILSDGILRLEAKKRALRKIPISQQNPLDFEQQTSVHAHDLEKGEQ